LDKEQPIYGLRAPDLDGVQQSTSVEALAEEYIADIRTIQETGPYQLCGLSFGGLVAFEMAAQLRAAGEQVGVLALFDTGNPAHYVELPPARSAKFRLIYLVDRLRKYGRSLLSGRLDEFASNARHFLGDRAERLTWKLGRALARATNRPMPKMLRSNLVMFSYIGRLYKPRPYAGQFLLFRAKGRTPGLVRRGVDC